MSKQKNMTGQIATLKKVMHYLKHYIPILILSVVLATVTVALTLYFPILTGRAIDLILDKGNVDFPGILAIAKEGAIVIGITAAAQWIMNMCNNRMTYNIVRDIRRDAFERIEHLPLSYIDSHSHGDMVSRIIADVDTFADGLLMGFTQLFTGLATIIGDRYGQNPFEKGTLFLFCGKRSDRCKGLLWMGTGFLLLYKRFEDGRLSWPRNIQEAAELTEDQYRYLMTGLNPLDPRIKDVDPKHIY